MLLISNELVASQPPQILPPSPTPTLGSSFSLGQNQTISFMRTRAMLLIYAVSPVIRSVSAPHNVLNKYLSSG